jgi:hypothetical protein
MNSQIHGHFIAAQGIVTVGVMGGRRQRPEITGPLVMVQDHFLIEMV